MEKLRDVVPCYVRYDLPASKAANYRLGRITFDIPRESAPSEGVKADEFWYMQNHQTEILSDDARP